MKLLVSNPNFFNSSASASKYFKLWMSYNLIRKGRVGHGAFFLLYSLADNPVEMWHATSCMTSLSVAKLGSSYEGFSMPNILMKVQLGEAY